MPLTSVRHGSSGADSWKSDDTVKGRFEEGRGTPVKVQPASRAQFECDGDLSPGSRPSSSQRLDIAPWEDPAHDEHEGPQPTPGEAAHSETPMKNGPNARSIHNIASFASNTRRQYSASRDGDPMAVTQHHGYSQNGHGNVAPPLVSQKSQLHAPNHKPRPEERRTSVTSATSNISNDSSKSRILPRKLTGLFGEDMPTTRSLHSTTSADSTPKEGLAQVISSDQGSYFTPKLSSVQASPGTSRPRSPQPPHQPSSEVTPWLFQDPNDINSYGNAPVRQDLQDHSRTGPAAAKPAREASSSHLRPHIRRHRRETSADQTTAPADPDNATGGAPPAPRSDTFPMMRRNPATVPSRLASKTSVNNLSQSQSQSQPQSDGPSETSRDVSPQPSESGQKQHRSLLDRIRGKNKDPKTIPPVNLHNTGASTTSLPRWSPTKEMPFMPSSSSAAASVHSQISDVNSPITAKGPSGALAQRREHHARLPFQKPRRLPTSDNAPAARKDPNQASADQNQNDALFTLDTDLSQMEGILGPSEQMTAYRERVDPRGSSQDSSRTSRSRGEPVGAWDAPDSWAVKRLGEDASQRQHEQVQTIFPLSEEDLNTQYCIRIWRPDNTFATLSVPINTPASDIIQMVGRRTPQAEDLSTFHIILRKHDVSRQLHAGERPVFIQKRLLEQVGYNSTDRIDEIGREDHSYLCRFNCLPSSMIGYSSLEKDPYFNKMQKFSNIDLSARNLITIPITLYQKSGEIVFLNLSRNLQLDVPKDFIQGCTSLREIRFTGNEAWHVPPSFSLASRLTVMDVSNNRLESLDSAEFQKLESLASLKLANNKLTKLPREFAKFKSLRSLNISSNFLEELPLAICEITTLVDLDISFNAIKTLPHIGQLAHLERLWCTNNLLSGRREDTIANLTNLREVDIRFNSTDNIDALSRLPNLEHLLAGHNLITSFEGSFAKLRSLYLDHNPITHFDLETSVPTLATLSLASCKLAQIPDELFAKLSGVTRLYLSKNHLNNLSGGINNLLKLDHLAVAKNALSTLPGEIGQLQELRFLDVRENNISNLPSQIWFCRKLETLNLSSNVLDSVPKPPSQAAIAGYEQVSSTPPMSAGLPLETPGSEDGDILGEYNPQRRGSQNTQNSGWLSTHTSPGANGRKGSLASVYGQTLGSRKTSVLSRTATDTFTVGSATRKDSMAQNRAAATMIGSLRVLLLADNRLQDEVFEHIAPLAELRTLNLSYNEIYEIPHRVLRRLPQLADLFLSGNELTSLPTDDLEELTNLKTLFINNNKFMVLPGELCKARKLAVLDAGSNSLKYNVTNWPYDWNWNANPMLKYLNLSGNKRLEIKPLQNLQHTRNDMNLTDFSSLHNLRILGLMDVTIMIPTVPDQTEDRRVRTSGSSVGTMAYGVADTLGRNEHLSTMDFVTPRLASEEEAILGVFDGVAYSNGGSKIAKYLQENFRDSFEEEMKKRLEGESPADALRRTFLALNKELAGWATSSPDARERRKEQLAHRGSIATQQLNDDDLNSGCVATVMFLQGLDLYVANVGDAEAVLIQSEGSFRPITHKHDPAAPDERHRIREAGGYVSRQGKLNDLLEVSRAFGFIHLSPLVIAAPFVTRIPIQESDEMILIGTRELWDYLTPQFAVDLARSERSDLTRAAQKVRDMAIAFGASGKVHVIIIGVSDLRKRERARYRTHSMSMGPLGSPVDDIVPTRRGRRGRDATLDQKLGRLDAEVEPPTGEISLVFTDIKNSTLLWETYQTAMRSAIKMHNELMRRQLRLVGGYEVKTEGDAFMVAFPTVSSALLWCFTVQSQLLDIEWPQEILSSVHGREVTDDDGNILFRGLSVRMGCHWGKPVCEIDPVTRRMDYFGPMVNRAARISAVADGGQITVSADFIAEVQRLLETHIETDRQNSAGSEDMADESLNSNIRRELRSLSSHGFEVRDLGERRLKGLENPEYIYLMYPHSLSGREIIQRQQLEADKASQEEKERAMKSQLTIDLNNVWELWNISLRLEMLCSSLEDPLGNRLRPAETSLLEKTKEKSAIGDDITDEFLVRFVEHQISRIETCITTLYMRNMFRPFKDGMLNHACPMGDIFQALAEQAQELREIKSQMDIDMADS